MLVRISDNLWVKPETVRCIVRSNIDNNLVWIEFDFGTDTDRACVSGTTVDEIAALLYPKEI